VLRSALDLHSDSVFDSYSTAFIMPRSFLIRKKSDKAGNRSRTHSDVTANEKLGGREEVIVENTRPEYFLPKLVSPGVVPARTKGIWSPLTVNDSQQRISDTENGSISTSGLVNRFTSLVSQLHTTGLVPNERTVGKFFIDKLVSFKIKFHKQL